MKPVLRCLSLLLLWGLADPLFAALPQTLNYQGRMRTSGGAPVPDSPGNTVVFRICADPNCTGGSDPLWTENWNAGNGTVDTKNGLFNVVLGSHNPISLPFDQQYYLEINFNGDGPMTPRQPLTMAPYAFNANSAQKLAVPYSDSATTGGTPVFQIANTASGGAIKGSSNGGTAIIAENSGAVGVAVGGLNTVGGGIGVRGQGLTGVAGASNGPGGIGVVASQGSGDLALKAIGAVDFTQAGTVDFTGATVNGLPSSGETNTASNRGTGTGVFSMKNGVDLTFKSLKNTDGTLNFSSNTDEIDISADHSSALWNADKLQGRNISSGTPSFDDALVYDGAQWAPGGANAKKIDGRNVSATSPSNDDVLVYNGAQWQNGVANAKKIDGRDVVATSPVNGDALVYNGSQWVNGEANAGSLKGQALPVGLPSLGDSLVYGGSNWIYGLSNANKLQGVAVSNTSPNNGEVLLYNNSNLRWEPASIPAPSAPLSLTNAANSDSTLSAFNTASGNAIYAKGQGGGTNAAIYGFRGNIGGHNGAGVRGESAVNGGVGSSGVYAVNQSNLAGSYGLIAEAVAGIGISTTSQSDSALVARNSSNNATGIFINDQAGARALDVQGGSRFAAGSTSFTSHVDFSGANVTNFPSQPIAGPQSISNATSVSTLNVFNNGAGVAVNAAGDSAGVSATASSSIGYGVISTVGGSQAKAIVGSASGVGPGSAGVFAKHSVAGSGRALIAEGVNLAISTTASGATGIALFAQAPVAISSSGNVQFNANGVARSVSFGTHVDFSAATITGWNVPAVLAAPYFLGATNGTFVMSLSNAGTGEALRANNTSFGAAVSASAAANDAIVGFATGNGAFAGMRGTAGNLANFGVVGSANGANRLAGVFGTDGAAFPGTVGSAGLVGATNFVNGTATASSSLCAGCLGLYVESSGMGVSATVGAGTPNGIGTISTALGNSGQGVVGRAPAASASAIGVRGIAVNGKGVVGEANSGIGVSATSLTGIGLFASGPVALSTNGSVQFNGVGKSVTFNTHVDFSNTTITGWNVPVSNIVVPLSLTGSTGVTTLFVTNTTGASAIFARASAPSTLLVENPGAGYAVSATGGTVGIYGAGTTGVSGTGNIGVQGNGTYAGVYGSSQNQTGVYGESSAGPSYAATEGHNLSSGAGVWGESIWGPGVWGTSSIATGVLGSSTGSHGVGGQTSAFGASGVFGQDNSGSLTSTGVAGNSTFGTGVKGVGKTGVLGTPLNSLGVGILASNGGFSGAQALKVTGNASFAYGSVTFNSHVDFSTTTITGWNMPVTIVAPLNLTGNTGATTLFADNVGGGSSLVATSSGLSPTIIGQNFIGNPGVSGTSATGTGVYGSGSNGVSGYGTNYGIFGSAPSGVGVFGSSSGGGTLAGVAGTNLGSGVGVLGQSTSGHAVYGIVGVSSSNGVRGDSSGTGAAVFGQGYSTGAGVQGQSNNGSGVVGIAPAGHGVDGTTYGYGFAGVRGIDSSGSVTSTGVLGTSSAGAGVRGVGVTGTVGSTTAVNGIGVLASNGGNTSAQALRVLGNALFTPGSVTFNAHVDFSSATVTGWNVPALVTAPLYLTSSTQAWPGAVINGLNNGTGYGVKGIATSPGSTGAGPVSMASTITAGVYGYSAASLSAGVLGINNSTASETAGVIAMSANGTGIYAISMGLGSSGGSFEGAGGIGVRAEGITGVAASTSATGGVAVEAKAYSPNSKALVTFGDVIFSNAGGPSSVSFQTHVDFSGANVTGFSPPISATTSTSLPAAFLSTSGTTGSALEAHGVGFVFAPVIKIEQDGNTTALRVTTNGQGNGIDAFVANNTQNFAMRGSNEATNVGAAGVLGIFHPSVTSIPNTTGGYGAGVMALNDESSGVGLYAQANGTGGTAIKAESNNGSAIYANSGGSSGSGLAVDSSGGNGYGVLATSTGNSGTAIFGHVLSSGSKGVYGKADGPSSYGVYGEADDPSSIGVEAINSFGGTALQVNGPAYFIGSVDVGYNKIGSVGNPSSSNDAVNLQYLNSALSGLSSTYLPLAGGSLSGDIYMNYRYIHNLSSPSVFDDAATKGYVDGFVNKNGDTMSGLLQVNTIGSNGININASAGSAVGVNSNASGAGGTAVLGQAMSSGGWGGSFTGAGMGVKASTGNSSGYGVWAENTGTAGNSAGLYATSAATTGAGIIATGGAYGVSATASATGAVGVYGTNQGTSGIPVGVRGEASGGGSAAAIGVWGTTMNNPTPPSFGAGVVGSTKLPSAYGVYARNEYNSGGGVTALWAEASGGSVSPNGVVGTTVASPTLPGTGSGVAGFNNSNGGYGIYGLQSNNGYGVWGNGPKGGVVGTNIGSPILPTNGAVIGSGTYAALGAVYGRNASNSANSAGVWGEMGGAGTGAWGVVGTTNPAPTFPANGGGIYGFNSLGTGYGVYGNTNVGSNSSTGTAGTNSGGLNSGYGVAGVNSGTSNTGYGVYGGNNASNGIGIYAENSSASGQAIALKANSSGNATNAIAAVLQAVSYTVTLPAGGAGAVVNGTAYGAVVAGNSMGISSSANTSSGIGVAAASIYGGAAGSSVGLYAKAITYTSIALVADNAANMSASNNGAALMVSGPVRVLSGLYSSTWAGPSFSVSTTGPAGRVRNTGVCVNISGITVTNPLVTTDSIIVVNWVNGGFADKFVMSPVRAMSGSFDFFFYDYSAAAFPGTKNICTGEGFNYMIINP